jgi:hypothetical protein
MISQQPLRDLICGFNSMQELICFHVTKYHDSNSYGCRESGAEVEREKPLHLHGQTFQMLGKMPQRRVMTRGFVCEKA